MLLVAQRVESNTCSATHVAPRAQVPGRTGSVAASGQAPDCRTTALQWSGVALPGPAQGQAGVPARLSEEAAHLSGQRPGVFNPLARAASGSASVGIECECVPTIGS